MIRGLLGLALVLAALSGCGDDLHPGGPLAGGRGEHAGGSYVAWPSAGVRLVRANYGDFPLCLRHGRRPAILRAVRPRSADADEFTAYVHTVTPERVASARKSQRSSLFSGVIFGLGSPPLFDEPYAGDERPGRWTTRVTGTEIEETCAQTNAAAEAIGRDEVPGSAFSELVIVIPSTPKGAQVDGFYVDYTVDGDHYRWTIPWNMVVCDRLQQRPRCGDGP